MSKSATILLVFFSFGCYRSEWAAIENHFIPQGYEGQITIGFDTPYNLREKGTNLKYQQRKYDIDSFGLAYYHGIPNYGTQQLGRMRFFYVDKRDHVIDTIPYIPVGFLKGETRMEMINKYCGQTVVINEGHSDGNLSKLNYYKPENYKIVDHQYYTVITLSCDTLK